MQSASHTVLAMDITMDKVETKRKLYWGKTIASFLLVLFTMPLGHALMMIMGKFMAPGPLHTAGFLMGLVGFLIVVWGVFIKGDTKQTLCGLFGGLLFWTGWIEFLFQYYARRYGTEPMTFPDGHTTQPEYLLMPMTFGLWMMLATLYIFSTRTGCDFFNWIQHKVFRKHWSEIVARPMTRHVSIVTFMELNMIMWTEYIVLMFCYDPNFIGAESPITAIVAIGCLVGSIFMFRKELRLASWGANIRMAIATVLVFWCTVEVLARLEFFTEIWIEPEKYITQMVVILVAFVALLAYVVYVAMHKSK